MAEVARRLAMVVPAEPERIRRPMLVMRPGGVDGSGSEAESGTDCSSQDDGSDSEALGMRISRGDTSSGPA